MAEASDSEISDMDDINTALIDACRSADVGDVVLLLEKGANINATCAETGNTALHVACLYGISLIGGNTIRKGKDLEAVDQTTLGLIKLLLEKGAAIQTNEDGLSPVDVAALNAKTKSVDHFVESGVISPSEQIRALEYLGMTLGINEDPWNAYKALHRAMLKRQEHNMPKSEACDQNFESFFGRSASSTLKELEEIKNNLDAVKVEAFLVGERVLPDQLKKKYVYTPIVELGMSEMVSKEMNLEEAFKIFSFCLQLEKRGLLCVGCVLGYMEEGICDIARFIIDCNKTEPFIGHVCNILAACPDVLREVECTELSAHVDGVIFSLAKILYLLTYDHFRFSLTDKVFDHVAEILTTIWGRIPKPVYIERDKNITTSLCHSVIEIMAEDSCTGALSGSGYNVNLFTRMIAQILQVEDALDVNSSGRTMFHSLMDLLSCRNGHLVMDIARLLLRHGCPKQHIDVSMISTDMCVEGFVTVMSLMQRGDEEHVCTLPTCAKELSDLIDGRQEMPSLEELSVRAVYRHRIPYKQLISRSLWHIVQDPILMQPEASFR